MERLQGDRALAEFAAQLLRGKRSSQSGSVKRRLRQSDSYFAFKQRLFKLELDATGLKSSPVHWVGRIRGGCEPIVRPAGVNNDLRRPHLRFNHYLLTIQTFSPTLLDCTYVALGLACKVAPCLGDG